MFKVFVVRVMIDEGGDTKSRRYGVMAASELDAVMFVRRDLSDKGLENPDIMETQPASPGEAASLNLKSEGFVGLLN